MKFKETVEMLLEGYDKINGKWQKNESKYFHYTNSETFKAIAKDLLSGGGLKGSYYPANTYTMGNRKSLYDNMQKQELCLVRSDRVPDNSKVELSGSVGDIKFTFDEEKIVNKFGKIKPIAEYPVQDRKFVIQSLDALKRRVPVLEIPTIIKIQKEIENKTSITNDEYNKYVSILSRMFRSIKPKELEYALKDLKTFTKPKFTEHMESRIRIGSNQRITKEYINKIYIPDYLNKDKEIVDLVNTLNKNKISTVWYSCRFPKE